MSILAIVISLLLLMFLAYRGISVLLLAPLMSCLAVLLSAIWLFYCLSIPIPLCVRWGTTLSSSSRCFY